VDDGVEQRLMVLNGWVEGEQQWVGLVGTELWEPLIPGPCKAKKCEPGDSASCLLTIIRGASKHEQPGRKMGCDWYCENVLIVVLNVSSRCDYNGF
jgi:hypothetical protein